MERRLDLVPSPSSCDRGEKVFRRILNVASKRHIPAGFRKSFDNGIPREAQPLVAQRDDMRLANPNDPLISDLNREIEGIVNAAARKSWTEAVESASSSPSSTAFWHLLRRLSGK